ncbi:porin [uncultured Deefgea sp.]|uniref:porin n=1 Tax=uncultured Deefgea sp. TaxID=1304914 RepID=UPI0025976470|nr:porin [uncultured Deefgea sp.]
MSKIIALSIAAALLAPFASAEVTISGSVRTAMEYLSPDQVGVKVGSKNDGDNKTQLADQSSRIRVSGVDKLDIGGDLVWVLESRFRVGDPYNKEAASVWGSRDTYIGYKGDYGFARFGKMDNAYKNLYKNISPTIEGEMNDTSGYLGDGQLLRRLGARSGSVIYYETPNFNGFNAHASYTLSPQVENSKPASCALNSKGAIVCTPAVASTGNVNTDVYQIGGFYKNDMFNVGAAYSMGKNQNSDFNSSKIAPAVKDGASVSGYMVGGNVKYMDFGLGLTWEQVIRDDGKQSRSQDSYAIAGSYKYDKLNFLVSYVQAADVQTLNDSGADQISVAASYNLSKRSKVYATYSKVNNDKNANFTTESGYVLNNGQSADLFSVGVRTDF